MPNLTLGRLSDSISRLDAPEFQCFYFHYSKELHDNNSGYFCDKHSIVGIKVVLFSVRKFKSITLEMKNDENITILNQRKNFLSTNNFIKRTLGNYLESITINRELKVNHFRIRNSNESLMLLVSIKYGIFAFVRFDGRKQSRINHRKILIKNLGRLNYEYIRKLCLKKISPAHMSDPEILKIVKLENSNNEKFFFELPHIELLDGWMCSDNDNFYTEDRIFDERAEFISGLKGKVDISQLHNGIVAVDRSMYHKIPSSQIDEGLSVGNRNSANWFHFLIEDLIAIWNASSKIEINVPLIVPDFMTANQMQALEIVLPGRRKIICSSNVKYVISKAYLPARIGVFHDSVLIPWDDSNFYNVSLIREFANFMKNAVVSTSLQRKEEKIFVVRGSNSTNMRKVFLTRRARRLLKMSGFIQIDAGKLSFADQIKVFNNAKFIVSVSGAAMANLLFCSSNAQVGLFMPQSLMDFSIWRKVVEVSHAEIFYQKCNPLIPEFLNLDPYQRQHQDIVITRKDVIKMLKNFNFPKVEASYASLTNIEIFRDIFRFVVGIPKFVVKKFFFSKYFLYSHFKLIAKKIMTAILLFRFHGK